MDIFTAAVQDENYSQGANCFCTDHLTFDLAHLEHLCDLNAASAFINQNGPRAI